MFQKFKKLISYLNRKTAIPHVNYSMIKAWITQKNQIFNGASIKITTYPHNNNDDLINKEISANLEKNIFFYTSRISIELSNLCNYAFLHKKCPLNNCLDHIVLPAKTVYAILDQMEEFNGVIAFHNYNEPLIDPRLFLFINYARKKCPKSQIFILTNGYYLNQTIADELKDAGVSYIVVTAYTEKEYQRLVKINISIPFGVSKGNLDSRMNYYDQPADSSEYQNSPCSAPLNELVISCNGDVILCCQDWKKKFVFGNISEKKINEIIRSKEMIESYKDLTKGIRTRNICKNCGISR